MKRRIEVVVLLAGVLPWLTWLAARLVFGDTPYPAEPFHEGLEIAGAAIALSVAMLLLLRLRHEEAAPHLLWAVAALITMGLVDGIHGMAHFGLAWSWLRHASTLLGGIFFGLVWLRPPAFAIRRKQRLAAAVAVFALALSAIIWIRPGWLPAPWATGDYSLAVKAANALGGLGFLAAALFFLRRFARRPQIEELVFAGHTMLFGIASLLFGFSSVWAADWWVWHGARLAAYGIVLIAAYRFVVELYSETARHGQELEALVQARTSALAASEERFRLVLKNAPIVMANLDRGLRYTWVFDPKGGLRAEELIGKEVGQTTDAETSQRIRASLEDVLARGLACQWEAASKTEAGETIFENHAEPLRGPGGEIAGIALVSIDITERKRAEEALKRTTGELRELTGTLERRVRERTEELEASNARLSAEIAERLRLIAAVEQTGVGLAIMDAAGRISYVNPAFEKTGGSARIDLQGTSYFDLLARETGDPELKEKVWALARRGETWNDHLTRRNKDGEGLEININLSPLRDQDGAITNYLAVERDVTREVRIQQQLRHLQKIEALGTLAGGIAHDFNNILNPIFINTELVLLDPDLDPEARRSLEISLKAAERGRDLVKQIITFSRQKETERRPSEVTPVLREALKFLRASLPATVRIEEDLRAEAGYILSDPARIHQVVMNLCNNAAYAMRENGGVLGVSLVAADVDAGQTALNPDLKPGPYLRLTVADTGSGMTKEVLERAFDPFFTTKKPGEGSGLGLAVVHSIVKDQGGAITVYSEPGKGSAFDVYFPRVSPRKSPPPAEASAPESGHERILLVDDEDIQVKTIKHLLERLGYRVTAATDGQVALALFRQDPRAFDLIITDQTMPHLTGLELAKRILSVRPGVPVILCTGFSETVDANAAQAAGIRRLQMKPFSLREMAETVRSALEKGREA